MVATVLEAKGKLESAGLHVSFNNSHSLWIAANLQDIGDGIKFSKDSCSLIWTSGRWVAIFPTDGVLTYEISASLSELVALITDVYANYRTTGGQFTDVFYAWFQTRNST